ncbi:probable proton-coupled zinc antiporter SLC30A3 [Falco biarmicus]|uniref:probable proton-coupled zinc antiporter SLC30A3 n=1 Tax=Falco biarmicus TaxID=345155 RepID=UPI0024BD1B67|nr:probable proton-coupled zinc antiporter SLC30A3 [Falco biarmicus]
MEPPTGTESAHLVSPRDGRADGSLRLKSSHASHPPDTGNPLARPYPPSNPRAFIRHGHQRSRRPRDGPDRSCTGTSLQPTAAPAPLTPAPISSLPLRPGPRRAPRLTSPPRRPGQQPGPRHDTSVPPAPPPQAPAPAPAGLPSAPPLSRGEADSSGRAGPGLGGPWHTVAAWPDGGARTLPVAQPRTPAPRIPCHHRPPWLRLPGAAAAPPSPSPGRGRLQARRQLSIACTVCCFFMVGEVIGGYLAHSLAIMTDAAHLLTDVGSMSVSLFSLWVSTRPPSKTMSFGWHRSETLGALASVLSIWVVTGALVYLAAARIISNDYEIEAQAMLATAASAIAVNLVMAYILHQSPTGHCHGTGGYEQLESSRGCLPSHAPLPGSTSVRAAFVHVVGDLLQSVGVLVAATIIYFKPQCKIADPISTLFFSVFVLGSTFTILRDVFRVLMEGTPRGLDFDVVKEALLRVSGVKGVHDLHLWALTLSHHAVSVHVAAETSADPEMVLQEATTQLQSRFGFASCTVQVERYREEMAACQHCQDPCT